MITMLLAVLASTTAPPLWRDITAGMTEAELRQLHPPQEGAVEYHKGWMTLKSAMELGSCHPEVQVVLKAGVVTKVGVWSRPHGFLREQCADEAQASLLGKYGEPLIKRGPEQLGPTDGESSYSWRANGVLIEFFRDKAGADGDWHVNYTAITDSGL